MRIGVLALQGDFREHVRVIESLGHQPVEVRLPADLESVDAIIIPGGESTTIGRLANLYGMTEPLQKHIRDGMPVLGTCAGMIFLAAGVAGSHQPQLGVLDAVVERNAYGRQNESFEEDIEVAGFEEPVRAVFIRAPRIADIGDEVQVLATHGGQPVVVRQGNIVAISFHPELTDDRRFHQMLIDLATAGAGGRSGGPPGGGQTPDVPAGDGKERP